MKDMTFYKAPPKGRRQSLWRTVFLMSLQREIDSASLSKKSPVKQASKCADEALLEYSSRFDQLYVVMAGNGSVDSGKGVA